MLCLYSARFSFASCADSVFAESALFSSFCALLISVALWAYAPPVFPFISILSSFLDVSHSHFPKMQCFVCICK
jgi:hypothetical protein